MNKLSQLRSVWRQVFALLSKASPAITIAVTITTVLEAIAALGVLYILKLLVDTITTEMTATGDVNFSSVLIVLGMTGAALVIAVLLQSISGILKMRQSLLVSDHVDREIHDRAISVDLRYYESPAYYDALERAREGGSQRPAQVVANAVTTFRAAITLIGIIVLLSAIEIRLLPALIIPIVIALLIRLYFTRRLFDWRMSRAQKERRAGYLDWVMTNVRHAKDLRINRIGPFFRDQYRSLRMHLRKGEIEIEQARLWSEFAMALVGAVVFIGAGAWLLQQSLEQGRPIGDVVLFVLLLRRAESSGKEFVGNVSRIVDDHLFLERLFDFLAVEPTVQAPDSPRALPSPIEKGLVLENVSFRYDEAPSVALDSVSMSVAPGQVVALVGENGSGKTTLIKLLTRLYDPTDGEITLDGIDIRHFDPDEYRRLMSVIFQDFAVYAETIADNIRYGDVEIDPADERIVEAATNAGAAAFIEQLPLQYQTPLTKLFDNGHDLSIGQWQRVALARAFFPPSKFMILDEPTSAVDPKAEFELFENFKTRLKGRSAIVISHRLSTVRQADYTYVLDSGKVVEHGTHDDLITAKGSYADLFEKQARHYR